jgi:hypothetical protein
MSLLTPQDLDDIKARNPLAELAGGYVKLRRVGGRLVGPCPICGGRATSQRFEIRDNGESWVCAVCPDGGDVIRLVEKVDGCDFLTAIERLGGRERPDPAQAARLFEEREAKRLAREKEAAKYRDNERRRLYRTWKSALRIHDTPAARYLEGRGLTLPESCPGLRYLPSMAYWHGEAVDDRGRKSPRQVHSGPAMCAAFIRADGTFGGLHLTWLSVSRSDIAAATGASPCSSPAPNKAEIIDPDDGEVLNSKKMRGSKTGAHILIADAVPPEPARHDFKPLPPAPRRLVMGEGIETVLAVYTAHVACGRPIGDMAFWAAGDLGNMAGRATETIAHPTVKRPDGRPQRVPGLIRIRTTLDWRFPTASRN